MRLYLPRFQFSLRTLVIVVVIVAACASWHASRYARYKARAAAKAQLASVGIRLLTADEALAWEKNSYPFVAPEESLAQAWDRYWFGNEAAQEYVLGLIQFEAFLETLDKNPQAVANLPLAQFPELVSIEQEMPWDLFKIIWSIDDSLKDKPATIASISDFNRACAKLPNLQRFDSNHFGLIDDRWVSALPERSELKAVFRPAMSLLRNDSYLGTSRMDSPFTCPKIQLTPAGAKELLRKAPALSELTLNPEALDAEVVELLNERFAATSATSTSLPRLLIAFDIPEAARSYRVPPELPQLTADYSVLLVGHAYWSSKVLPTLPVCDFSGCAFRQLEARDVAALTLANCRRLESARFDGGISLTLRDCPQLQKVYGEQARLAQFRALPRLEKFEWSMADAVLISDCPALQQMDFSGQSLELNHLEQLQSLIFFGSSLFLNKTPRLTTVELDGATAQPMDALLEVPSLQNLSIRFKDPPDGTNEIRPQLVQFKKLQRLALTRTQYIVHKKYPDFSLDLRTLTSLRVLVLSYIEEDHLILPYQDGGQTLLPPQLEVLITPSPVLSPLELAILHREHPQMIYINDTNKLGGKFSVPGNSKEMFPSPRLALEKLTDRATLAPFAAPPASAE